MYYFMDLNDNSYYWNVIQHHEVVIHSESLYSAATVIHSESLYSVATVIHSESLYSVATVNIQTSADFFNINVRIFCPIC